MKAVRVPSTDQVVVDQTKVTNLEEETSLIATALAEDASRIRPLLQGTNDRVGITGYLSETDRAAVQKDIDAGKLPGVTIESGPVVAVSDPQGVSFLDAVSLSSLNRLTIGGRERHGARRSRSRQPDAVPGRGRQGRPQLIPININDTGPSAGQALTMPGPSTTSSGTSRRTSST